VYSALLVPTLLIEYGTFNPARYTISDVIFVQLIFCCNVPCSRQITTPAPHFSVVYRPAALPAAQPTASKH